MCWVPMAVGITPVRMQLREGAHTGDAANIWSNTVPSAANAAMAGIATVESPYSGKNSPWSSHTIHTMEAGNPAAPFSDPRLQLLPNEKRAQHHRTQWPRAHFKGVNRLFIQRASKALLAKCMGLVHLTTDSAFVQGGVQPMRVMLLTQAGQGFLLKECLEVGQSRVQQRNTGDRLPQH